MNLVLGLTGASGAHAAERLVVKAPWPLTLVASRHGREVFEFECGRPFQEFAAQAHTVHENTDLWAPVASGSVATRGMVVLPCSTDFVGQVASGRGDTLLARAAHCHLKSGRPLILCWRESPVTLIDLENAARVRAAGGIVMPLSPPFYLFHGRPPATVSLTELMDAFVDRVLQLLGHEPERTWGTVR
jgi:4-hydroxy-3-polyprenylbenzoate decarboxylase